MSAHFNMPEFDHKAFSKYLTENKLTPFSNINSLIENIDEIGMFHDDRMNKPFKDDADKWENGAYHVRFQMLKNRGVAEEEAKKLADDYENKSWEEVKKLLDLKEAVPFEKDALDEIVHDGIPEDVMKIYNQEIGKGNFQFSLADAYKKAGKPEPSLTDKIKQSFMFQVTGGEKGTPGLGENTELEEMANFFMVTQDQKDKIDPNKYSGTKKLVAQALKSDEIEVGQPFTKATIKNILGKDPLKDFNAVLDAEEIGGMGKTADVRPQEPKTPGVRGRKPGEKTEKEPTTKPRTDKVVGVKDIDGPRAADVTAAEKELGGAKGIDRTIAIDKAGKVIIDKLKNSKEQLKDPKFKEAKRLAFIAYLTRPKADGGKIGLRKGGETYTNLLNVWDNTVEDLIS